MCGVVCASSCWGRGSLHQARLREASLCNTVHSHTMHSQTFLLLPVLPLAAASGCCCCNRGFVSHTPNASLVLRLDTRSKGATRAVPQLTTPQKVQLLQRHGMFRAATELLTAEGAVPMPRPIQIPAAPDPNAEPQAAAGMKIWRGNGLEAAMAEAERQAAEAAIQLRLGQVHGMWGVLQIDLEVKKP